MRAMNFLPRNPGATLMLCTSVLAQSVWTVEQRLGQGGDDLVNLVDISVKEELAASQAGFVGPLDQQLHEVFD